MRLTRLGAVLIVLVIGCAIVVVFVSGPLSLVAGVVAGLILLMMVGEGIGSGFANPEANLGRMGEFARKREVLTRNARVKRRDGRP